MYTSSLENVEALIRYVIIINFSLCFNLPLKAEMTNMGKKNPKNITARKGCYAGNKGWISELFVRICQKKPLQLLMPTWKKCVEGGILHNIQDTIDLVWYFVSVWPSRCTCTRPPHMLFYNSNYEADTPVKCWYCLFSFKLNTHLLVTAEEKKQSFLSFIINK